MSVTRINKFEANEGMAAPLRQFLISIVPLIRQARGCTSCQLLGSQEHLNEFLVVEVWESVLAHQASMKTIPPEKLAEVMSLLTRPPNGSYYEPVV